jgi:hypothetical protein
MWCKKACMEIQHHNWRVACILVAFKEVQFESKLIWIGLDFQKDRAFEAQGLTS